MMRSLLLKLGMLALTTAAVFWIGWAHRAAVPNAPQETLSRETDRPFSPVTGDPAARSKDAGIRAETTNHGARPHESPSASPGGPKAKLDLNRATAADFERLPGIGPVLAKTVWEDRESRGPFRTVEDLKRVKGIGAKRLERMRPLVMVQGGEAMKRKPQ